MLDPANRFHAAVSVLCGHGEIKQRLVTAYQDNLEATEESELPPDVAQQFMELRRLLSCVAPLNGEGKVRASVRKMSVDEAERCARMIVDLHTAMMRRSDDELEILPREVVEQTASAPPFLVKSGSDRH